mmetsp:Transcript_36798/g.73347  ORF Transcript_36798/g.73347 Transcript_36798/m.73347 type:complete len:265 (-) Transcript_36798:13-807(-)
MPCRRSVAPSCRNCCCTPALFTVSTSSAPSAPSFCMSLPYDAIAINGVMAPSPAIIVWQVGFSASEESAPVAACCTLSSSESRSLTSGGTAPCWQISSWWKLSAFVVGSSRANACMAVAARYCRRGSGSPRQAMRAGKAPPATTAERKRRACSVPDSPLDTAASMSCSIAPSFEVSEPCSRTAMTSVSVSLSSAARPAFAFCSSDAMSALCAGSTVPSVLISARMRSAPPSPSSTACFFLPRHCCGARTSSSARRDWLRRVRIV